MKMNAVLRASAGLPVRDTNAALFGMLMRKKPTVYGFRIDPDVSDPAKAVTYLRDAVGKTPAQMGAASFSYGDWADAFFMPRPCMLRYDGTVAYYLDPDDYSKKADGTPSDIANTSFEGNAMMEWGLIWYKFEAGEKDGEGCFYVSDKQVDDTYHCWCNYDAKDNVIPHFYTAIYNGTIIGGRMRSLSGLALGANGGTSRSGQQEVDAALANNVSPDTDTYPEWYTAVWSDYSLISALLILIGRSIDLRAVFGRGYSTIANPAQLIPSYVTGTAGSSGGLFRGSTSSSTVPVKVFGMENWWGTIWHRRAGMSVSDWYCYKLTYGTADGSAVLGYGSTVTGHHTVMKEGTPRRIITTPGNIDKMQFGDHGFIPLSVAGDELEDYYCSQHSAKRVSYLVTGGATGEGALAIAINNAFTSSQPHIGTSLSCKPHLR